MRCTRVIRPLRVTGSSRFGPRVRLIRLYGRQSPIEADMAGSYVDFDGRDADARICRDPGGLRRVVPLASGKRGLVVRVVRP
jgi:hypothetical protein